MAFTARAPAQAPDQPPVLAEGRLGRVVVAQQPEEGLEVRPLAVVVAEAEPAEVADAVGAAVRDRCLDELASRPHLCRLRAPGAGWVAGLLDAKRRRASEAGLRHVALTHLGQALEEGVTEVLDRHRQQEPGREGAGVDVEPDPVGGAAQARAAAPAHRAPEVRVGGERGAGRAEGVVEADLLVAVAEPQRRALGLDHAAHERLHCALVEPVGGVLRIGDVHLVRDLEPRHGTVGPERPDHRAHVAQPLGDVAVVAIARVVAHL